MAPNSRPPLTSRIRASFEGKRAKSDNPSPTHPTYGAPFVASDTETLKTVLEEALNSETFQNAIAASLAKLINPSIKSALDTIQPVVEAVYSHEVLLRKTNRSVENILERVATNQDAGRPLSTIDPLGSNPFNPEPLKTVEEAAPAPPAPAPAPEPVVVEPKEVLSASPDLGELRQILNESYVATTTMKGQLDQMKVDLGTVMEAIGTDLGKNVQEISEKVAALDLSPLAAHTEKLDAIATDLGAVKGLVETGNTGALAALEGHAGTLAEIKDAAPHPDILAALQQSNDSHATHTTALAEIKEKSLGAPVQAAPAVEGGSPDNSAALAEIKADLELIKQNIETGLAATTESVTGVGAQVDTVLTTIEGHKASDSSAEILAAVIQSNESHASHTSALEELKTSAAAHTTALETHGTTLEGIKSLGGGEAAPPTEGGDTAAIAAQITALSATLDGHSAALDEIKSANAAHTAAFETHGTALEGIKSLGGGNPVLEEKIAGLATALDRHTATLEELKVAATGHTAALEGIKSLAGPADNSALDAQVGTIIEALGTHTATLEELKAIGGSHTTILDQVVASQGTHTTTLDEVKAGQGAHTTILEEIKASPGAAAAPAEGKEDTLSSVVETLESHTKLLNEIKEDVSAEILTALHDFGSSQAQQTEILTEIRQADLSDELLTLLHSSSESHASHTASLNQVLEAQAGHSLVLEEMKSKSVEQARVAAPAGENNLDLDGLEEKIGSIAINMEEHKNTLAGIKELTQASHDLHLTHSSSLDEIKSRSIPNEETSPPPAIEMPNIGTLEQQIGSISDKLVEHDATLAEIKNIAQSSHELHNLHTASLEDLNSRSVETTSVPADMPQITLLEEKIIGIASTLLDHNASLATIKETTAAGNQLHVAHALSLDEIKSRSIEPSVAAESINLEPLGEKIVGLAKILEEHSAHLEAIKEATASHTLSLDDLKSRSIEPTVSTNPVSLEPVEEKLTAIIASLEELKSKVGDSASPKEPLNFAPLEEKLASLANILEEHQVNLLTIKEATGNHSLVLDEVKSKSIEPNSTAAPEQVLDLSPLEEKISSIVTRLEEHKIDLSAIKDATNLSNEAHTSHTTALGELQAIQPTATSHQTADLSALDPHFTSITSTLGNQSNILVEIKEAILAGEILTSVRQSHEVLVAHTSLLEGLKDPVLYAEILEKIDSLKLVVEESKADVSELHTNTLENHSNLSTSIAALAVGGLAGAGATAAITHDGEGDQNSKEILEEVKAVRAIVEETKGSVITMSSQLEINHTTITTSLSSLDEELKAEMDATGTQITDSLAALNNDIKNLNLTPIVNSVEQCAAELKGVSTKIDTLHNTIDEHGSNLSEVSNGVHLNDKGISQLKEHIPTTPPITEGAWMRPSTARSLSRQYSSERMAMTTPVPYNEPTPEPVSISSTAQIANNNTTDTSSEPSLQTSFEPNDVENTIRTTLPNVDECEEPEPERAQATTEPAAIPPSKDKNGGSEGYTDPTTEREAILEPKTSDDIKSGETKTGIESETISQEKLEGGSAVTNDEGAEGTEIERGLGSEEIQHSTVEHEQAGTENLSTLDNTELNKGTEGASDIIFSSGDNVVEKVVEGDDGAPEAEIEAEMQLPSLPTPEPQPESPIKDQEPIESTEPIINLPGETHEILESATATATHVVQPENFEHEEPIAHSNTTEIQAEGMEFTPTTARNVIDPLYRVEEESGLLGVPRTQFLGSVAPSTIEDWQSTTEGYAPSEVARMHGVQAVDDSEIDVSSEVPGVIHGEEEQRVVPLKDGEEIEVLSDEERHSRELGILENYEKEVEPESPSAEGGKLVEVEPSSPFVNSPDQAGRGTGIVYDDQVEEGDGRERGLSTLPESPLEAGCVAGLLPVSQSPAFDSSKYPLESTPDYPPSSPINQTHATLESDILSSLAPNISHQPSREQFPDYAEPTPSEGTSGWGSPPTIENPTFQVSDSRARQESHPYDARYEDERMLYADPRHGSVAEDGREYDERYQAEGMIHQDQDPRYASTFSEPQEVYEEDYERTSNTPFTPSPQPRPGNPTPNSRYVEYQAFGQAYETPSHNPFAAASPNSEYQPQSPLNQDEWNSNPASPTFGLEDEQPLSSPLPGQAPSHHDRPDQYDQQEQQETFSSPQIQSSSYPDHPSYHERQEIDSAPLSPLSPNSPMQRTFERASTTLDQEIHSNLASPFPGSPASPAFPNPKGKEVEYPFPEEGRETRGLVLGLDTGVGREGGGDEVGREQMSPLSPGTGDEGDLASPLSGTFSEGGESAVGGGGKKKRRGRKGKK